MKKYIKQFVFCALLVFLSCCVNEMKAYAAEIEVSETYTGVVRDGYDIYYYENGEKLYGYQVIDGNAYFFDWTTGKMLYDSEKVVSGHWVYYKPDGVLATGWTNHHGNTYYYDDNGWMLYGYQTIDGNQYYFDPVTGVMFTGERVENGHWVYYSEVDGAKAYGWTNHHGNTYYYDDNGWMLYGYQTIDGANYYFHTVTGVMYRGERVENGHWVYYSEVDGAKAYGWTDHHGNTYYYNSKGWMLYNDQIIDGKEYYFDSVTGVLKYGFYESEGKIYYIDKQYNKLYGKQVIDGKVVLFDDTSGALRLGLREVDGQTYYYINTEPYVYTGEIYKNGAWRFFDEETGAMATGWAEHHGHTYYYNEKGEMQYGHQTIDGKKYFFDTVTGVMYTGEKVVNGHWVYYSEEDGAMATGWTEHHGHTYYYDENGWMLYGLQTIDGEEYMFNKVTGVLMTINGNRVIDPDKPMVALTLDDGPSTYTPRILNCLEEHGQAATFFVVGYNAARYGSTMQRMLELGCEIGNHSYNHPDLTTLSYSGIVNEMASTNSHIYAATGTYATVSRTPGGSYNSTVKSAISTPIIMWSIDTLDWKTRDTWSTVNCVLNNVEDGDIVLMHDIHSPTIAAAEILIPELVARGYQLVTVSELAQYRGNGMQAGNVYYSFK